MLLRSMNRLLQEREEEDDHVMSGFKNQGD